MSEQAAGVEAEAMETRGGLARVEAFSDGVFAIAITLLVLQLEVPSGITSNAELWQSIKDQSGDLLAFGISFAVIGRFWIVHHQFVRRLTTADGGFIPLNLVLLALVVLVPFFSQILGEYGDLSLATMLYATNLVALCLIHFAIYSRALRKGQVRPEGRAELETYRRSWLFNGGVFAASIPLALVLGSWTPLLWLLLAFDPTGRKRSAP